MTCSGPLSIRQVSFRGCLPRKKIYLSLVTRKDCFQALKWLLFWTQTFFWSLLLSTQKGYSSGGEIEATTGNTSVFTDYEMAVEVYLKQETKFQIRNFFFPRYYDNLNSQTDFSDYNQWLIGLVNLIIFDERYEILTDSQHFTLLISKFTP